MCFAKASIMKYKIAVITRQPKDELDFYVCKSNKSFPFSNLRKNKGKKWGLMFILMNSILAFPICHNNKEKKLRPMFILMNSNYQKSGIP